MSDLTTTTNDSVQATLAQHESVIERGLSAFVDVGNALVAIKAGKLYRESGFASFEDYCSRRWDISRSRGYQLVAAAATVEALVRDLPEVSTMVDIPLPDSERQVRPLSDVGAEQRAGVWVAAVEAARGETPTAAQVQDAVDEHLGRAKVTTTTRTTEATKVERDVDLDTGEVLTLAQARAAFKAAEDAELEAFLAEKGLAVETDPEKIAAIRRRGLVMSTFMGVVDDVIAMDEQFTSDEIVSYRDFPIFPQIVDGAHRAIAILTKILEAAA